MEIMKKLAVLGARPRRVYNNDEFLKSCFCILDPYIVSCHTKDFSMPPYGQQLKLVKH